MALNYVTLTCDVYDAQGNAPVSGTATFTPSATLTDTTNHQIIAQIPLVVSFRASGPPVVKLLATDNGTLAPSGWGWTVSFTGTGMPAGFSFFLPFAGGASQNLSSISPTSSVVTMSAYLPIDYPTGAASGYVWTSTDNAGTGAWRAAAGGGGSPTGSAGGDLGSTYPNPTVVATHLSAALPVAQGGTGQGTQQAAIDALAGAQTAGNYLRGTGSHVQMSPILAADLPTATASAQGALIAGDTQETTPLIPDASALYSSATRLPVVPQPTTVVTDFQSGHGWTGLASGGSTYNVNDTGAGNFSVGSQAASATTDGGGVNYASIRRLAAYTLNATNCNVRVRFMIPDVTHLAQINVFLGNSSLASNYKWIAMRPGATYVTSGDWITCTLSFADAATTGSPTKTALTDAQLQVLDDGGGTVTAHWQTLELIPDGRATFPKGVVSITFDDSYSSPMTQGAWATMDANGWPGSLFLITDALGTAGCLQLSDVKTRSDVYGWEVAGHAYTGADHNLSDTGLTASQLDTDARNQRAWLAANGIRSADGYAYPLGNFGVTTDSQNIIGILRRYYSWSRMAGATAHETWPPGDKFRLRAVSNITSFAGGVTAAAVNTIIDNTATFGGWQILVFHKIVASSPGTLLECSIADFNTIMSHLASSGVQVLTVGDALRHYSGETPAIDTTAADIQALAGSAAAGASGMTADAKHVHPNTGLVTGVTAGDTSIVVGGTSQAPTVATGTLDVIATQHPPAANWSNNSHKITSLANGSVASDAAALGQVVNSISATDTSIVVTGGATTTPTVATGTLDVVAAQHPPAADWSNNSHKITSLATATTSGDALPYGQAASSDLSGTYPGPTVAKINGVTLSGTPAVGQALVAQSSSTAKWVNTPTGQLGPIDHGLIAWNFPPYNIRSSDSTPLTPAGKVFVAKLLIPYAVTITNIIYNVVTVGNTLTANQCFAGLYNSSKQLLALTADQSTNMVGTGNITAALTSGQAVSQGYVYVVWWYNGTTGPALARGGTGAIENVNLSAANSVFATADTGITTSGTAPGTLATFTALSTNYWAAVS